MSNLSERKKNQGHKQITGTKRESSPQIIKKKEYQQTFLSPKIKHDKFLNYFSSQCEKDYQQQKADKHYQSQHILNKTQSELSYLKEQLSEQIKYNSDQQLVILQLENQLGKQTDQSIEQIQGISFPPLIIDLNKELIAENQKIKNELKLETQSRQILYQQIQKLKEDQKILQTQKEHVDELYHQESDKKLYRRSPKNYDSVNVKNKSKGKTNRSHIRSITPEKHQQIDKIKLETQLQNALNNIKNLESAIEQKNQDFAQKEQNLNDKIYRLEKQLKSRNYFDIDKKKIVDLEKENQELKETLSHQRLVRQTDGVDFNRKMQVINQKNNELQNENNQLKQQLNKMEAKAKKDERDFQSLNTKLKINSDQFQQQLSEMKNDQDKVSKDQKAQMKEQNQKLKKMEQERNELLQIQENQMKDQQLSLQKIEEMTKSQEKLESEYREEKSKYESDKDQMNEKLKQLEEQNFQLQEEIKVLKIECSGLKKQVEQLNSAKIRENDIWESEIQRLQQQINSLQNNLESIRESLQLSAEQQQTICLLDQDNENIRGDVDTFQFDINESLVQQIENIKHYISDLNDYLVDNNDNNE